MLERDRDLKWCFHTSCKPSCRLYYDQNENKFVWTGTFLNLLTQHMKMLFSWKISKVNEIVYFKKLFTSNPAKVLSQWPKVSELLTISSELEQLELHNASFPENWHIYEIVSSKKTLFTLDIYELSVLIFNLFFIFF